MLTRTNHGLKLSGIYPGRVVQHLDNGRCKVFIPGVYPDESEANPDTLPPAEQAAPLFGGANLGNGSFSYPNIGAVVWCMFQNGDQNLPVYFAARLGGDFAVSPKEEDAKSTEGFSAIQERNNPNDDPAKDTSRNGDDFPNHMINCGDSRVVLKESGQIEITCVPKDDRAKPDSDKEKKYSRVTLDRDGNVYIESTNAVYITSPTVEVNASDMFSVHSDLISMRADTRMDIYAPALRSVNPDQATFVSPTILLDGHEGAVMATGKNHGFTPVAV